MSGGLDRARVVDHAGTVGRRAGDRQPCAELALVGEEENGWTATSEPNRCVICSCTANIARRHRAMLRLQTTVKYRTYVVGPPTSDLSSDSSGRPKNALFECFGYPKSTRPSYPQWTRV